MATPEEKKGNGNTPIPARRRSKAELRELLEEVSENFCKGVPPKKISESLSERYGEVKRESAYRLLQRAAELGILVFRRQAALVVERMLKERLQDRFGVKRIRVASTTIDRDVAIGAADMIADALAERARGKRKEVKLGWAGGRLCRTIAQQFADRIKRPDHPLPRRIACQTLVGAWDVESPMLHPNAFFSYFSDDEIAGSEIEFNFKALYAPVIVSPKMEKLLKKQQDFIDAVDYAKSLDIVITSASLRADPSNMLHKFYEHSESKEKNLPIDKLGCVGDFLALPFSKTGPIPLENLRSQDKPLTLLSHKDIEGMIHRGTDVILAAGPCRSGNDELLQLRTDIIEIVIRNRLASSLCVDFQTGKDLVARFT